MVEKHAEEIFNLCCSLMKELNERLALIWKDLENTNGHREHEACTELDKIHRKPAIECGEKGMQLLLEDLGHARIHVFGSPYEHELDGPGFIEVMIMRLPQ